jgi:hypothetical protein
MLQIIAQSPQKENSQFALYALEDVCYHLNYYKWYLL